MQAPIRVRADLNGGVTDVQTLIKHPMDSGFAKNESGELIPARYIEVLTFEHRGRIVFTANWGPMIARDPYIRFSFRGGAAGDTITVKWQDSQQASSTVTARIESDQNPDGAPAQIR